MFKRIARYYDCTNRLLSLGLDTYWRTKAVKLLRPRSGENFLDVGCGTGDIALEIVKQCPDSTVIGIDPTLPMLDIGNKKVADKGVGDRIRLIPGDALNLEFRDNTFAGAITSFCIRNVTDRQGALREISRVVKPGGSLIILELTEPLGPIMKPLFRLYSRVFMPLLTALLSSAAAYKYLSDSMAEFPPPDVFKGILERNGFEKCDHTHLTGGIITIYSGIVGK
jgi:demethylmenaquinone methyltransferase / 2-methoxy-6-polyprenyl-1,4-benzoquinol methylase